MNKKSPALRSGFGLLLPVIAMLLGVALAFMRANELAGAFEGADMLPVRGDTSILIMRISTAAAVVLLAALAFISRPKTGSLRNVYAGDKVSRLLYIAGALGLVAAAVIDYTITGTGSMARMILQAVTLLAGVMLILALISSERKMTALFSIGAPLFACFWLIILYRDRTVMPTVEVYIYDMLAATATILAFYHASAYAYEAARPRTALFSSLAAVTLSIMSAGGSLIAHSRGAAGIDLGMQAMHCAAAVWALGASVGLSRYKPAR